TIHEAVKAGGWPKPSGISLANRVIGVVGFGDIGRNIAKRALAADMQVVVYDPAYRCVPELTPVIQRHWPEGIEDCDFLVLACSLNAKNRHMLNERVLTKCKKSVRIVNVARGP